MHTLGLRRPVIPGPRGGSGAGWLARGQVFLVLAALSTDLEEDVDEDHVDDHTDPAERDDQPEGLDKRFAGGKHHGRSLPTESPACVVALGRPPGAIRSPRSARRGAGAVERARLEIA